MLPFGGFQIDVYYFNRLVFFYSSYFFILDVDECMGFICSPVDMMLLSSYTNRLSYEFDVQVYLFIFNLHISVAMVWIRESRWDQLNSPCNFHWCRCYSLFYNLVNKWLPWFPDWLIKFHLTWERFIWCNSIEENKFTFILIFY